MQTNDKCLIELFVLSSSTWNHLTMCIQMSSKNSFKIVTNKLFAAQSASAAEYTDCTSAEG